MSAAPQLRMTVGVVVERRRAISPWANFIWRPTAALAGAPEAAPWTVLATDGDTMTYYAGTAELALYRSEVDRYRDNLVSGAPSIWIVLQARAGDPPVDIAAVTADPAEGEAWTEPGQAIVEAVAMPPAICDAVAAFVVDHPATQSFTKRVRDRADPEALARQGTTRGHDDKR
jgi:Protein of unknown function (DUF3305)